MRKQFKFISVVFASSILLTPLYNLNYSNNLANAKENEISTISENKINAIKLELEKYIDDKKTVDTLIYKLENNIPWDNINGSKCIKEEIYKQNKIIINKKIFKDGSFIIKKINLENSKNIKNNNISLRSLSGGNYSSGSGWYGYEGVSVSSHYGGFNYGFTADYYHYSDGNGQITNLYNPWNWGVGTFSNKSLYIGNSYGNPAYATYSLDYTVPGGWFTKDIKITLYVNGSEAWDDDN